MKKLIQSIIAITLLFSTYLWAEDAPQYQSFDSDVQVIDVRSDAEWLEGHHPAALHVPHTTILEGKGFAGLDKNKPVVLYCRSGGRAERARSYLLSQGFSDVSNAGGISDLILAEPAKE